MPLKRRTPLRRRTPLKAKQPPWLRTKKPKQKGAFIPRKKWPKLRKMAKKRQQVVRLKYYPLNTAFLRRPENRFCYVCICRWSGLTWTQVKKTAADFLSIHGSADMEPLWREFLDAGAVLSPATEVHHQRGRIGRLLCDVRFFVPGCNHCRCWPHENLAKARKLGLIAPAKDWNVYPG